MTMTTEEYQELEIEALQDRLNAARAEVGSLSVQIDYLRTELIDARAELKALGDSRVAAAV